MMSKTISHWIDNKAYPGEQRCDRAGDEPGDR